MDLWEDLTPRHKALIMTLLQLAALTGSAAPTP